MPGGGHTQMRAEPRLRPAGSRIAAEIVAQLAGTRGSSLAITSGADVETP